MGLHRRPWVEPRAGRDSPILGNSAFISHGNNLPSWGPTMGPRLVLSCTVPVRAEWMVKKEEKPGHTPPLGE